MRLSWNLLISMLCLLLTASIPDANGTEASLGRGSSQTQERNGWGEWADGVVGRGSKPSLTAHPVQMWLETLMRNLGNHVGSAGSHSHHQKESSEAVRQGGLAQNRQHKLAENDTDASEEGGDWDDDDMGRNGGNLIPVSYGTSVRMSPDDFQKEVDLWMENNPDVLRDTIHVILWGGLIFLVATGLLVYSEVRTVLLTRETDELAIAGQEESEDLCQRISANDYWRPYLSLAPIFVMVATMLIVLSSLCFLAIVDTIADLGRCSTSHPQTNLLESMGFEFKGCYTLILVGAFVITGMWCLIVVGLCWICTRPWSGGLCVALSLLGETAIETEEPVSVVVWAMFSCVAAYIWFRWGKHIVNEVPGPDPEKKRLIPT